MSRSWTAESEGLRPERWELACRAPTRALNSAAREVRCSRTVERLTLAVTSIDHGGEAARRRRARWPIVAGVLVALLVALAFGAYLYDHSRRDVIAKGVRIDGIAVGGLHEAAARAKLERDIVQRLNGPVVDPCRRAHVDAHRSQRRRQRGRPEHGPAGDRREPRRLDRHPHVALGLRRQRQPRHPARGELLQRVRARADGEDPRRRSTARRRTRASNPAGSGLRKVPGQDGRTVENDKLGGAHRGGAARAARQPQGGGADEDRQAEGHDRAARGQVPGLHRGRPQRRSGCCSTTT